MIAVSVIIPAYNASEFITEAIESIIKQDYKKCEIVVVDDGSSDQTRDVLEKYINAKVVRYFFQTNSGPGAARNRGLTAAQGEYICFLDADDELVEGSLSKRVNFLEKNPELALAFTDFFKIYSTENRRVHCKENNFLLKFDNAILSINEDEYIFGSSFFECAIESNPFILTSTVMIRANAAKKIGFFNTNLKVAEDIDYWLRVCRQYSIGFIDEPLTKYNNFRSVLTKNVKSFFEDSIIFYTNLLEEVKEEKKYIKLLKKKISIIEFDYGYYLFQQKQFKLAKNHFRKSFLCNKNNLKTIKWNVISLFPNILVLMKKYVK